MSLRFAPFAGNCSPLCRCCEAAAAEGNGGGGVLVDSDLGPICVDCSFLVRDAEMALDASGLLTCAPLGPGKARGDLGG